MAQRLGPSSLTLRSSRNNSPALTPPLNSAIPDHVAPLLGKDAQTLIECNQKLKELGIDETITLPQICVIGDQSTGKSSLIEAISTVQVPKAKGCCTQCPIAINLSSGPTKNSPWSCTVYIEVRYDFVESLVKKINKSNPLGPWQERKEINSIKLKTTRNKDEVAHLIRVAQAAVLDPGTNPDYYLSSLEALQNATQVAKFSPNVIRLDISEADWPSLSFIDLPGVIANTGKTQDKYLVTLIKNLVLEYAHDQRSVNMLTLPMTHDVENSQACAIIQELHVEDRTLAVFTKSDLADSGQREQFLTKFLGTDDELGFQHGYHIVMMPDNVTAEDAKRREADFFGQAPWCDLPSGMIGRLGVPALSNYLRRLLFEKTADTLPGNLKAIEARLASVTTQLAGLPAPLDNALLPWKLQQDLVRFESVVLDLYSTASSTHREWNERSINFRKVVVNSRPTMVLFSRSENKEFVAAQNAMAAQSAPNGADTDISENDDRTMKSETHPAPPKFDPVQRFRLDKIRSVNQAFYSAYFPGEIDPKAVDELNKISVQNWNKLLDDFMQSCSKLLHEQIRKQFGLVFAKLQHLEIYSVIDEFIRDYVDKAFHEEWTLAEEVCKREQTRPFTMDCEALKAKEEHCLDERRKRRSQFRSKLVKARLDAEEGVSRVKREEAKEANLGPDPWDLEVQMSAKTRAYYEIASCRFTDIICQSIFYNLLPKCGAPLIAALKAHLGVEDPSKHATIIQWMEEHKDREALRRRLTHEQHQLSEGHKYIQSVLGNGSEHSPGKRRQSEIHEHDGMAQSPSKRLRLSKTTGQTQLPQQMEGVENDSHHN